MRNLCKINIRKHLKILHLLSFKLIYIKKVGQYLHTSIILCNFAPDKYKTEQKVMQFFV